MPQLTKSLPSYRRHRASGQAVVHLAGRDIYLGLHGTKVSKDNYDRVVGEWLATGRAVARAPDAGGLKVLQLVNAFRKADVAPASQRDSYKAVMSLLVRLYGRTDVADFGPLALKAVRIQMVAAGWKRRTINDRVQAVRLIVRWGVEQELVSSEVLHSLEAVRGLREGKTKAPESVPVKPVAVEHVTACLRFMAPSVQAMVKLQMYTGMRPGELCQMRTGEIDTTGAVWVYTPGSHKTKHLGKSREIAIGPQAIAVLKPYLLRDLQAFIFSPVRADAERRAIAHAARKTPLSCGNRPSGVPRELADRYDTPTYRNAIEYATRRAFPVPADLAIAKGETTTQWRARLGERWAEVQAWRKKHHWHPHQLRHTFGTLVRQHFDGLDHTQAALGHSHAKTSEIYAKVQRKKAVEVAAAIG